MALGAITDVAAGITPRIEPVDGGSDAPHLYKIKQFTIVGDSSYPTGGSSLTAQMLGLTRIDFMKVDNDGGHVPVYDYTNSLLKVFVDTVAAGPMAELANATNDSTTTYRALVVGV